MLRAVASGFNYAGGFAYASLPSAATYSGYVALATDLGSNGVFVSSNGTRWRAISGQAILKGLGAPVTGIANTETIVIQTLLPIGSWQTSDSIRIWAALGKSGTTDSGLYVVRIGTAGTTADTAITGFSGNTLAAATVSAGFVHDIKLISATSAQKVGNAITTGSGYGASSTVAPTAATTITDASLNALYVSVTYRSSSTNDTVSISGGCIEIITP